MNLVSTMVGLSIAGTAMPMIAQMSMTPIIAQKQAANFAVAESQAVAFAAANEWQTQVGVPPDNCSVMFIEANAYSVTCFHGLKRFRAEVTRSFRLYSPTPTSTDDGDNGHGNDLDGVDESNPGNSKQYCPYYDPLGETKQFKNCIPVNSETT